MKKLFCLTLTALALFAAQDICKAQYYKDLFQDSGINLTSREDLPAARFLGLSYETYYSAKHNPMALTVKDTIEQTALMVGSTIDENGVLLYPDGAPRFRMIYVNGGRATKHGNSLTPKGIENIRTFVANGGSYVGSCAGSFIASAGNEAFKAEPGTAGKMGKVTRNYEGRQKKEYFGVYPGRTVSTDDLNEEYTGMIVEKDSPLLKYYDFGGDMYIDSVYHNGGSWIAEEPYTMVPGTEILLRYDYVPEKEQARIDRGSFPVTGKVSCWAYKKNGKTGRVVLIGSHPEGVTEGDRLELTAAMFQYAMDGAGRPEIKGELKNGEPRQMVKSTVENDPAYTRIGDKQYHHFNVVIPKNARNIKVVLESPYKNDDLYLTMTKNDFAFLANARYHDITLGCDKEMKFDNLESGMWFIGVHCATTVETVKTDYGVAYTGHLEVLNGVPYTLTVTWDE